MGTAMGIRFSSVARLSCVLVAAPFFAAAPAQCEPFDLGVVFGREFWPNAAALSRGQIITLPSAQLPVTDAAYCGADAGSGLEFLVGISKQAGEPLAGLAASDCARPTERVRAEKQLAGVARVRVAAAAVGVRLHVVAAKLAAGAFSAQAEQELGIYQYDIAALSITMRSRGRESNLPLTLRIFN